MAYHFIGNLWIGHSPNPKAQQKTGNNGAIDLECDAIFRLAEQMAVAQSAFQPTKKQFHAPAITVGHVD